MRLGIPFSVAAVTILFCSGPAGAKPFTWVLDIDPEKSVIRGCAPASPCEELPVSGLVELYTPDLQAFSPETSLRYLQGPFVSEADGIIEGSPVDLARRLLADAEHFASSDWNIGGLGTRYFFEGRSGGSDAESILLPIGQHVGQSFHWTGSLLDIIPGPAPGSYQTVASFWLEGQIVAIPEPGTALLLGLGSGLMAASSRRMIRPPAGPS